MAAEPAASERARSEGAQHALEAPPALNAAFLRDHGGDNHFDQRTHRWAFPDGRVGSHSLLATREQGEALLAAAVVDAVQDVAAFEAEH